MGQPALKPGPQYCPCGDMRQASHTESAISGTVKAGRESLTASEWWHQPVSSPSVPSWPWGLQCMLLEHSELGIIENLGERIHSQDRMYLVPFHDLPRANFQYDSPEIELEINGKGGWLRHMWDSFVDTKYNTANFFENTVWISKSPGSFLTKGTSSLVCALHKNN